VQMSCGVGWQFVYDLNCFQIGFALAIHQSGSVFAPVPVVGYFATLWHS
jgi:hypothetical protein